MSRVLKVVLELPLPPAQLHAHNKGQWRSKSRHVKACRELAFVSAREEAVRVGVRPFERARMSIDFYWSDRRRRDTLNAVQSIKPYIDGMIDAKLIIDDNWTCLEVGHVRSHLDRTSPRVQFTVENLDCENKLQDTQETPPEAA